MQTFVHSRINRILVFEQCVNDLVWKVWYDKLSKQPQNRYLIHRKKDIYLIVNDLSTTIQILQTLAVCQRTQTVTTLSILCSRRIVIELHWRWCHHLSSHS